MRVYLDNNATTSIHPLVKEEIIKTIDLFGNPSTLHHYGRIAQKKIQEARYQVADFLNASPSEIIFTSGGTESNNIVLKSLIEKQITGDEPIHIITSEIEHPSILKPIETLKRLGVQVSYLTVNNQGIIRLDELTGYIQPNTKLISIMLANNEIGTIQPLKEVVALAKKNNVLVHTDAVQAVGKIQVDIGELGVDFLSFSGHKCYAPKGIGGLYIRKGVKIHSFIEGGSHEKGRRGGTENIIGIAAMGRAFSILKSNIENEQYTIAKMRNKLEESILRSIPESHLNGDPILRLPGTSNIRFNGVEGEAVLLSLDSQGIAVSTGSACSSGSTESSHVLKAIGLTNEQAHSSVRFSLGNLNNEKEIDFVIKVIPQIIHDLRILSSMGAHPLENL